MDSIEKFRKAIRSLLEAITTEIDAYDFNHLKEGTTEGTTIDNYVGIKRHSLVSKIHPLDLTWIYFDGTEEESGQEIVLRPPEYFRVQRNSVTVQRESRRERQVDDELLQLRRSLRPQHNSRIWAKIAADLEDCMNKHNFADADEQRQETKSRCKVPTLQRERRSEVDSNHVITDQSWAISLARLPDFSSEHAFLVIEGITGEQAQTCFADFVADKSALFQDSLTPNGSKMGLLYRCNYQLMNVKAGDKLLSNTWIIDKDKALSLIREVKAMKPPKYNILGDTMLSLSSAKSSSNETGHNCFTFAKMVLRNLNEPTIRVREDTLDRWVVSATSRYLQDDRSIQEQWYEAQSFKLMFGALTTAVVALAMIKVFHITK